MSLSFNSTISTLRPWFDSFRRVYNCQSRYSLAVVESWQFGSWMTRGCDKCIPRTRQVEIPLHRKSWSRKLYQSSHRTEADESEIPTDTINDELKDNVFAATASRNWLWILSIILSRCSVAIPDVNHALRGIGTPSSRPWILYSGCTSHLCGDRSSFDSIKSSLKEN